jgi:paraquat-inducible protein B
MASPGPTAVGGFVFGGLAIVVAAILFFGGGDVFAHKDRAVVYFQDSVGGLTVGAPVTFRGVRVGSVSRVALMLDPATLTARIPVYLELEPKQITVAGGMANLPMLQQMIEAGLRAKLEPQSLVTGEMLVELDLSPGTPARLVGPKDSGVPEIPAVQSDLQELRQELSQAPIAETVAQALRTLAAIEKLANHVDGEVGPLAASARGTLESTARTMDTADTTLERLGGEASGTLADARGLLLDARGQLAARGGDASRTLTDADKTLEAARGLIASANSLLGVRTQSRTDLDASLRDLAATTSSLRDFAASIERDPGLLLRGGSSR